MDTGGGMDTHKLKAILGADRSSAFSDRQLQHFASYLGSEQALEDLRANTLQELFPGLPRLTRLTIWEAIAGWQNQKRTASTHAAAQPMAAQPQAAQPGAAPIPVLGLSNPVRLAKLLLGHFSLSKNEQRAAALAKRNGPVPLVSGSVVDDPGQYLALVAYEPALDHLLRVLMRMHDCYTGDDVSAEGWIFMEQLLRVIGAPGLGKTTFSEAVWSQLLARLWEVQRSEPLRWARWQEQGAEELWERLRSWEGDYGPLVFRIDMSRSDLQQQLPEERRLPPQVGAAARMLFACCAHDTPTTYGAFFAHLQQLEVQFPHLLASLTPLVVQYFVHFASGLEPGTPSLVVFVWDEANSVPLPPGDRATFLQHQLAEVVGYRELARRYRASGTSDMMMVPVVVSTRASAVSLGATASRKAGIHDLRLPLIKDPQMMKLLAMDLLRRLPLPPDRRGGLASCDLPLHALSQEERDKLAEACPSHLALLLQWVGSNPRTMVSALGVAAGEPASTCHHTLTTGGYKWLDPSGSPKLNQMVSTLLEATKEQKGWSTTWFNACDCNEGSWTRCLVLEAVAYSMCRIPVTRGTILYGPDSDVTGCTSKSNHINHYGWNVELQELEMDGIVELRMEDGISRLRTPRSTHNIAHNDRGAASVVPLPEPPLEPELLVHLPPLMLAAFLQRFQRHGQHAAADVCMVKRSQIMMHAQWWAREGRGLDTVGATRTGPDPTAPHPDRDRDATGPDRAPPGSTTPAQTTMRPARPPPATSQEWEEDIEMLTLRLQLLNDVLRRESVEPQLLLGPLAAVVPAGQHVLIPKGGFTPTHVTHDLEYGAFTDMVTRAVSDRTAPWALVFNGQDGPGDSAVVLQLCDDMGQASGKVLVIHVRNTLQTGDVAATWVTIAEEASKVWTLQSVTPAAGSQVASRVASGSQAAVIQTLLYAADERPPKRQQGQPSASAGQQPPLGAPGSDHQLGTLQQGLPALGASQGGQVALPVIAVFRDDTWHLRAAMRGLKQILDEGVN